MRKKLLSLILTGVFLFSFCISGCFNSNTANQTENSDSNIDDSVIDDSIENENKNTLPNNPTLDSNLSNNMENNSKDSQFENADLLAIVYDRLENADLSFNFSFDVSSNKVQTDSAQGNSSNVSTFNNIISNNPSSYSMEVTANGSEIYESTSDEYSERYSDVQNYDYFSDQQNRLETIRTMARNIADYAIDNITVMDTVVVFGFDYFKLNYDSALDVVTVYHSAPNYSSGACGIGDSIIKIYNDEDGDETIAMTWLHDSSVENYIYTPNKYYSIKWGATDVNCYYCGIAYKEHNLWRGVQYYFFSDNTYLTHDGVYDFANGGIGIEFLFETSSGLYTFRDKLKAYRDNGGAVSHGDTALSTDTISINPYDLSCYQMEYNNETRMFSGYLFCLDGWKKVRFVLDTNTELSRINSECFTQGDGDYLELDDGTILAGNTRWSEEDGLLYTDWDFVDFNDYQWWSIVSGYYYDTDGNIVFDSSIVNVDETQKATISDKYVIFNYINAYIDRYEDYEIDCGWYNFSVIGYENEEVFLMLEKFFETYGLSVADRPNIFSDMTAIYKNRTLYTDDMFEYIFNKKYNAENIAEIMFDQVSELNGYLSVITHLQDESEILDYTNLPEKPEDIGLVSLTDNISGNAIVSEQGIDFSGITVNIGKSVILSKEKQYGIYVGWTNNSGVATCGAFEQQAYNMQSMVFIGKADIELPSIVVEGEYSLLAFFCKYEDNGYIRLSEIVPISVNNFETFSVTVPTEGGYYSEEFGLSDGRVNVKVTFVDTAPPLIYLNDEQITNNNIELEVQEGVEAFYFIQSFRAYDMQDGDIPLTTDNLLYNENTVSDNDIVTEGEYTLTVYDKTGNVATVSILVKIGGISE
jgi:hypothetical protein